jgi:hypothetical protein
MVQLPKLWILRWIGHCTAVVDGSTVRSVSPFDSAEALRGSSCMSRGERQTSLQQPQHHENAQLFYANASGSCNGPSRASLMFAMASAAKKPPMNPEPTRLRQIVLVAHDLERARHLLVCLFPHCTYLEREAEDSRRQ